MYFRFLLHRWPHISRAHLVSKCVTLFLSPLSACLLLSHSSRATRRADVPVNEASSSEGSSATALLDQLGEPRRQRWGKAATVTVVPGSSQSSLMTPVGKHRAQSWCQDRARGRKQKERKERRWSELKEGRGQASPEPQLHVGWGPIVMSGHCLRTKSTLGTNWPLLCCLSPLVLNPEKQNFSEWTCDWFGLYASHQHGSLGTIYTGGRLYTQTTNMLWHTCQASRAP